MRQPSYHQEQTASSANVSAASDLSSVFIIIAGALTSIICYAAASLGEQQGHYQFGQVMSLVCFFWFINFIAKKLPALHFINSLFALALLIISAGLGVTNFMSSDVIKSAESVMYICLLIYGYGVAMLEFNLGIILAETEEAKTVPCVNQCQQNE